ncbi:MAG TPA: hypothetical protein VFU23_00975, partial [Gemmatimonadales bacterium]|nr:hypothetical protein [Gemmatimonadales bacterium]
GAGHIVVLFRMKQAPDSARLAAFLAALDTARQTPAQAVAIGGPEIGSVGEVTVDLQPGAYVLACVIGGVGHRHAGRGESRVLQVKGPAPAPVLPSARIELGMADYAYTTAAVWPAGAQVIKVSNTGREDHQVRIDRLRPGVTLSKWMTAEDRSSVSEPVIGVARTGPGQTAFLPVKLTRGSYVLYCLVPAAASGTPHAMMGMMRLVTVE